MKKRILSMILIICLVVALLPSCSDGGGEDSGKKVTKLEYWFGISGTVPVDLQEVNDYINTITKEKINVEVKLKPIAINNYETTMSVKINAADTFDICFTSEWCNSYIQNAKKGAFLALDDLLEQYAPDILESVPAELWDIAKVNGKIYGTVNQQILPRQSAVVVRKDMADAFGLKTESIKDLESLTPYLEYCKQNAKADQIAGVFDMTCISAYFGWDDFGRYDIPGVIKNTDSGLKVYNQFESAEFQSLMKLGKSWYEKGYYGKDILTAQPNYKTMCLKFEPTYKPGLEAEEAMIAGHELIAIPFGEPTMYTSWNLSSLSAVSATSKNPEKSLEFLDLLYSDEKLFNTLIYGIENKHYKKVSSNRVELIPDSGYILSSGWEFGNQFNQWLTPTQADDIWEQTKQINNSANKSTAYGFVFDQTNVRTEIANCKAVYDEYWMALLLGLFGEDTQTEYQNFLTKLKDAGGDKIIAEKQRQINEWKAQ